ncbi:MAG: GvpL/GvpF family gas vesicle protein [Ignavibacteriales bacterium]|nr:GvpL/GvpF family gas vesicle protein [Ignavibacteriales bacterium]
MIKEGKYIYCIICAEHDRYFKTGGVGNRGDEVQTIGHEDLSMVVSSHPLTKINVNRENMLTHEKIIEVVMKEYDSVLPLRFGTIASSAEEIRNLLDRRYSEFKNILWDVKHKIELGVKGLWTNIDAIFNEIVEENIEIKRAKEMIQQEECKENVQLKMEVGKLVYKALQKKKRKETQNIIEQLQGVFADIKLNKTVSDETFMNAAFLVDKGREKEFDNIMDDLGDKYRNKIMFKYAGPLPAFNFTNIVMHPEAWER